MERRALSASVVMSSALALFHTVVDMGVVIDPPVD